jgi:hypothetical protein
MQFPVFLALIDIEFLLEFFDTSTAVDELLLSCKERVAGGADIQS